MPTLPDDQTIARRMAEWRTSSGTEALFLPRPFCVETCAVRPGGRW